MAEGEDENKKAKPSCLHLLQCKSVLGATVNGMIEEGDDLDLVVLLPSSNAVDEAVDFVIEINI